MKLIKKWLNNHPELKRSLEGLFKLSGLIILLLIVCYLIQRAAGTLNIL